MMRARILLILIVAALAWSCAAKAPVAPPSTGPRYPDFTSPAPPDRVGDERTRARHERAWQMLQAGDVRGASKEFLELTQRAPSFYPAAVGLGYALVADGKPKDAVPRFDQAIRLAPKYAPALAGKGDALLAAGQRDAALASFEAAFAADRSLVELRRRVDVLRFGRMRDLVAAASKAAEGGRLDEARRGYEAAIAASPESAFLYRDLGVIETRMNALDPASAHLQKAVAMDATDAKAWVALADVLEKKGEVREAVSALERAFALDSSDALRQRLDKTRERADLVGLPDDYKAIPGLAQVTRGDLAALLGVHLQALVAANRGRSGDVATDVRNHWAAAWIVNVTRAGLMDVYPNHTFQPRSVVRRVDLAQVVSRVLAVAGVEAQKAAGNRPAIADVGPDHLRYKDVAAAVGSGVMTLDGTAFRPSRIVSGAEAVDVIQKLERLTPKARRGGRRP
jgi:tetratricopeptide (TPR) repeat protein